MVYQKISNYKDKICKSIWVILLPLLLIIAPFVVSAAEPTRQIGFQGQLYNSGSPVNTTVSASFQFYDALTGGGAVGSAISKSVTVTNGYFSTTFSESDLLGIDFNQSLWLEVVIEGSALVPRSGVNSVPFANKAFGAFAYNAAPTAGTSGSLYFNSSSKKLFVSDGSTWLDIASSTLQWSVQGSDIAYSAGSVSIGSTTHPSTLYVQGLAGQIPLIIASSSGNTLFTVTSRGNVGIGSSTPSEKLTVNGNALFYDEADPGLFAKIYRHSGGNGRFSLFNGDGQELTLEAGDGYLMAANTDFVIANDNDYGNPNLMIEPSAGSNAHALKVLGYEGEVFNIGKHGSLYAAGNVGIGTTSPSAKLDVWGNVRVGTSSTPVLFVNTSNSRVGINNSSPASMAHFIDTGNVGGLVVDSNSSIGLTVRNIAGSARFTVNTSASKVDVLGTDPEFNVGAYLGGNRSIMRLNGEALFSYKASDNFMTIGSSDSSLTLPIKFYAGTANPVLTAQKNGDVDIGSNLFQFDASESRLNILGGGTYRGDLVFGNYSSVGSLPGGAGFFMGTGVTSSATANSLTKVSSVGDQAHFFYTRYDRGLELHTGITGSAGSLIADTTNMRLRVDGTGQFIFNSTLSSTALSKYTFRGEGSSANTAPLIAIANDTDDSGLKGGGIYTRTRMTSRYLATNQNMGFNDNSFGNPGVIQWTAWEYSNNTYSTLATPAEFSGWSYQYYNGSAYVNLLRIHTSGIGIGMPDAGTAPSAKLHVISTGDQLRLGYDASNYYTTTVSATGTVVLNAVGSGAAFSFSDNVGVGTTTPTQKLVVAGNAQFTGVGSGAYASDLNLTSDGILTTSASDIRLKENILELATSTLEKLLTLKTYTFTWKNDPSGKSDIGMIAQEVEGVFPEITFTNAVDGFKGINYSRLSTLLLRGIQEQQVQIDVLKKYATFFKTKEVLTEKMCLGNEEDSVCITKDQLRQLLIQQQIPAQATVSNQPGGDMSVADTTTPSPSTEIIPEESGDISDTPDPGIEPTIDQGTDSVEETIVEDPIIEDTGSETLVQPTE